MQINVAELDLKNDGGLNKSMFLNVQKIEDKSLVTFPALGNMIPSFSVHQADKLIEKDHMPSKDFTHL